MRPWLPLAVAVCLASSTMAETQTSALRGRVVDAVTNEPVAGALVRAAGGSTRTDNEGAFLLSVPRGELTVEVSASGFLEQSVSVTVGPSEPAPLEILVFEASQFAETVTVRARRERREEPAAVPVAPQSVMRVAGSLDNVFRTLQTLPGVAATEDFGSRLSVRGGAPDQNLTMMDGVEIHNPYRLFGLTSAFNPETVAGFELTAGGFSAKYGDRLSSLLVVENREGRANARLAGSTAASITDANVILEGELPGGALGSWLVTGRRTYYDLVAERIVDDDLPSFGDVQAKLAVGVSDWGTLSLFGLTSRENTDLAIDPNTAGEFGNVLNDAGNDLVSVTLDSDLGERTSSRTILSWYRNRDFLDFAGRLQNEAKRSNAPGDEALGFTDIAFDRSLTAEDLALRQDTTIIGGNRHVLETGFEFHRLETGVKFETAGDRNAQEANGSSVRGGAGLPEFLDSTLPSNRAGAWIQDRFALTPAWTLSPGIRFDWSDVNGRSTLSPRFGIRYALDPATRLRGALGLYTQSPGYEKLIQSDYFIDFTDARALDLSHERSTHAIAGIERDMTDGFMVRVEGFYKSFDDIIVGRLETDPERLLRISRYDFAPELAASVPTAPIITSAPSNDASGRAYGFDVYLARDAVSRDTKLTGWIAYTWTRADRDAYGRTYAFDYDRRHALNIVGSYRLSRSWTIALTGRLASGFPYTPAVGVRVAATEDPLDPTRLVPERDSEGRLVYTVDLGDTGNLNSGRLPFYARLDVRASWRPGGDEGRFELYFEAINALNRDNAINVEQELRYDPKSDVPRVVEVPSEGFPFLPSFGVRFRF